jgi:hypothetical protein
MRFVIRDLADEGVLAGSSAGAQLLQTLVAKSAGTQARVVLLDFAGVQVATGSYLREAVLGFRDHCRRSVSGLVPVVANASAVVREELNDLLVRTRDALVICDLDSSGQVTRAQVLGALEEKQSLALRLVIDRGETDAPNLASSVSDDRIGSTGWNNRLAALAARGILTETRRGRLKRYRPVVENLQHGS